MSTGQKENGREPRVSLATRVGVEVYQQIAAVFGAFAILALLTNFVKLDWRGFLATAIGVWDDFVRPPVRWLLHYLVEVPFGWLSVDLDLPQWLHDYCAVGFVLAFSFGRAVAIEDGWSATVKFLFNPRRMWREGGLVALIFPPIAALTWPAFLLVFSIISWAQMDMYTIKFNARLLAPVIYAGILAGVNFLLR